MLGDRLAALLEVGFDHVALPHPAEPVGVGIV